MPEYEVNWHHRVICEHLDKFARLEIKRLMIFAPPRHGKCLAQGSQVLLADGRVVPIEKINRSDMVISIDSWYNRTKSFVLSTSENGEKPVLKITLQSGRYVVCTENHPLLTVAGWKAARELSVGGSVAAVKQLPIPDGNPLPFGFASLMGYIIGDGSFGKGEPIVTTSEPETVAHLQRIADAHGWRLKKHGKYGYHIRNLVRTGRHDGTSAVERLRAYMIPAKSAQKRVPPCIFQANRSDLCDFLAAYFNCDGTATGYREGVAEFYSTSEGLLRDVQILLLRLGIYSALRIKRGRYNGNVHVSWRLTLRGGDVTLLSDALPVIGVRGRKLREIADRCRVRNHYPEYEAIPSGWQNLRTTRGKRGGDLRKALGLRIDKNYKHGTARHIVKRVAEFEDNDDLRRVCNPDIVWDRIVSIELLGSLPTYDIEVEDTHNFIVDGTVVHNSQIVSRHLPAYILGRNPDVPIIAASFGDALARRMNRDVQRIIDSDEYRRIFPQTQLYGKNIRTVAGGSWLRNSDEFEVVEYNGYYRGSGVGGAITGMGMKYGIIDDPVKNRQEANSQTVRDGIWDWYTSTFRTRLAPGGGILITVTRWHDDGLEARLLKLAESSHKADQWTVLSFPAIAEEPLAGYDIRRPGRALWPAKYDEDDLETTRISVGSYDWNSLYQQRPAPPEGGMFKRHWFKTVKAPTVQAIRVRYWDKAGTQDGGAYSCGVLLAQRPDKTFCIEDVVRGQWSALEREQVIKHTAQVDKTRYGDVTIWQEQEPGSGGKESAENTVRNLVGFTIRTERVTGDKVTRAGPFAAQCEAGNVYMVEAPWNFPYLDEMASFPFGKYKDQADASSGAFNKLASFDTPTTSSQVYSRSSIESLLGA